jgi:hypothetical protein
LRFVGCFLIFIREGGGAESNFTSTGFRLWMEVQHPVGGVHGGDEQLQESEAAVGGCDDGVAADVSRIPVQRCEEVAFTCDGVADTKEVGVAAAGTHCITTMPRRATWGTA